MTREEAIKELQESLDTLREYDIAHSSRLKQALEMAIQALSSWEKYSDKLWKEAYERGKAEALSQEPTVQDKQAESEKYQKAFDDGYANGYAQARFDYEQEPTVTSTDEPMTMVYPTIVCDDAISREAVLKKQYRIDDSATLSTRDVVNVEDIEDEPSVTQKSGKWIEHEIEGTLRWVTCSKCNCEMHKKFNYCPNCGAKMVEPQESEDKG